MRGWSAEFGSEDNATSQDDSGWVTDGGEVCARILAQDDEVGVGALDETPPPEPVAGAHLVAFAPPLVAVAFAVGHGAAVCHPVTEARFPDPTR